MKDETLEWKPFVEEAPGQEEKVGCVGKRPGGLPARELKGVLSSPHVSCILDTCRIPGGWEVGPAFTQVKNMFPLSRPRGSRRER